MRGNGSLIGFHHYSHEPLNFAVRMVKNLPYKVYFGICGGKPGPQAGVRRHLVQVVTGSFHGSMFRGSLIVACRGIRTTNFKIQRNERHIFAKACLRTTSFIECAVEDR